MCMFDSEDLLCVGREKGGPGVVLIRDTWQTKTEETVLLYVLHSCPRGQIWL